MKNVSVGIYWVTYLMRLPLTNEAFKYYSMGAMYCGVHRLDSMGHESVTEKNIGGRVTALNTAYFIRGIEVVCLTSCIRSCRCLSTACLSYS